MILRKAIIKVVIKRESFIVGYYNQPKNKKQENKLHKCKRKTQSAKRKANKNSKCKNQKSK